MRWLLVLLALPLASADVVHEDPIDDHAAPHPALLKEFDIAQVQISNATQDEWGFDGVIIGVAYDCPPPHNAFVTNRTTHFTFTVGNETVRQGVWTANLDWCSSGHATGIVLEDGCLITDIWVEAVWERQDGVQVLDRAPDAGGLTFDACPASAQAETRPALNAPHNEPSGNGSTDEPADAAEREVPAGLWLGLVALAAAARRRF